MTEQMKEFNKAIGEEVAKRLQDLRDICAVAHASTGVRTTLIFDVEISGGGRIVHAIHNGIDQIGTGVIADFASEVSRNARRQHLDVPGTPPRRRGEELRG